MNNEIQIGKFRGAPVLIDATAIILALLMGLWSYNSAETYPISKGQALAASAATVVIMMSSILLHELGHVFAASLWGVRSNEIRLHILGGWAQLNAPPPSDFANVTISAAGPIVNVGIWGAFSAIGFSNSGGMFADGKISALELALYLSTGWNLILAIFNLLPILPLDGGSILESLLSIATRRADFAEAWAARFSLIFGAAIGAWLLTMGNVFTVIVVGIVAYSYCWPRAKSTVAPKRRIKIVSSRRRKPAPLNIDDYEIDEVLTRATHYADQLRKPAPTTVELLLALLAYETSPASQYCSKRGANFHTVWSAVSEDRDIGVGPIKTEDMSPVVKIALRRKQGRLGMFLSLPRDCSAAELLRTFGIELAEAQSTVARTAV